MPTFTYLVVNVTIKLNDVELILSVKCNGRKKYVQIIACQVKFIWCVFSLFSIKGLFESTHLTRKFLQMEMSHSG